MNRLYSSIQRVANARSMTALLTLALVLMVGMNAVNLPFAVPRLRQLSGGARVLDTELFYSAQKAYAALDALQPAGRAEYLGFLLLVDSVFPLVYSAALAILLTVVFRSAFRAGQRVHKLALVPLAIGAFDYLENLAIITLLLRYPWHLEGLATLAGYFTLAKWSLTALSLLLLLLGLLGVLWRKTHPE